MLGAKIHSVFAIRYGVISQRKEGGATKIPKADDMTIVGTMSTSKEFKVRGDEALHQLQIRLKKHRLRMTRRPLRDSHSL